jgi:hypothetical protein
LSPDTGVHDALLGSEVEWLVGNRVPETKKQHMNNDKMATL